jgi:hypothetical protein
MTPGIPGTVIEDAESSPSITATKPFRGWSGGTNFRRAAGIESRRIAAWGESFLEM